MVMNDSDTQVSGLTENIHSSLGLRLELLSAPGSLSPITFSSTNKATNTPMLARMVKAYLQWACTDNADHNRNQSSVNCALVR